MFETIVINKIVAVKCKVGRTGYSPAHIICGTVARHHWSGSQPVDVYNILILRRGEEILQITIVVARKPGTGIVYINSGKDHNICPTTYIGGFL
jgi:hypothetical protein